MARAKCEPFVDRLDNLLTDTSMPEVVAGLARLSRQYKEQLKRQGNSEHQGWEAWEQALAVALREGAGQDEHDELLADGDAGSEGQPSTVPVSGGTEHRTGNGATVMSATE